jgi:hypothetical protein
VNITKTFPSELLIFKIEFSDIVEKKKQDVVVALINKMLGQNNKIDPISDVPCNKHDELLKRIDPCNSEIDKLVYDLYELIEQERKIIQANN